MYSIFVSRVDVYTEKHVLRLSSAAQGQVGLVNAKRLWQANREFWKDKPLRLQQEIIFASTGAKKPTDAADKYVAELVGDGIQTDPPDTLEFVERAQKAYPPRIHEMPPQEVLDEIDREVDVEKMEQTLMAEGTKKFADPFKTLLGTMARKRERLSAEKSND